MTEPLHGPCACGRTLASLRPGVTRCWPTGKTPEMGDENFDPFDRIERKH